MSSSGQPVTIPFFPAAYAPLDADWNSWIQAPFTFLTSKVVFRAELTAALTLTAGTNTLLPFNSILEDPLSGWAGGASAWEPPAGYSGTYLVSVTAAAAQAGDLVSTLQPSVALNGGIQYTLEHVWPPGNQVAIAGGSVPVQMLGGQDQVSAYAWWQGGSNGSVSTTAGRRCSMEITWISL